MTVSKWMHVGTVLKMNALNFPDKLGCQDKHKTFTFKEWNERSCRLASSLKDMGVGYQERFAIIAYRSGWRSMRPVPRVDRSLFPSCFALPLLR